MALSVSTSVSQFLNCYAASVDKGRFFTQSQLFIAFRKFLARTNSVTTLDYKTFLQHLEKESKTRQLQIKTLGNIRYFKLFKHETCDTENEPLMISSNFEGKQIKIPANQLNIYLTCRLCCGYLVEATTITECLHSFCRSCIIKYLNVKTFCPICNIALPSINPLMSLKADIVLQDIVNKILPGVAKNEQVRKHEFERHLQNKEFTLSSKLKFNHKNSIVTFILEWVGEKNCALLAENLIYKYIRLSDKVTVAHIAQFVLRKLEKVDKSTKPLVSCEILSGGVVLPPILTLHDIIVHGLDFVTRKGVPVFHFNIKPLTSKENA